MAFWGRVKGYFSFPVTTITIPKSLEQTLDMVLYYSVRHISGYWVHFTTIFSDKNIAMNLQVLLFDTYMLIVSEYNGFYYRNRKMLKIAQNRKMLQIAHFYKKTGKKGQNR